MVVSKITAAKRKKKQEVGKNCVKRGSIMCIPYEISGDQSKEDEVTG
jgi:hypothetical protein